MRKALERMGDLYSTSRVFQDLVETGLYTGMGAAGQAVMTDMTPEEIALSSAAMFGAGMAGRPLGGAIGQRVGRYVDNEFPEVGKDILEGIGILRNNMPKTIKKVYDAKVGPIAHLGGATQYGDMIGRGYGDNLAQLAVALASPGIFGSED